MKGYYYYSEDIGYYYLDIYKDKRWVNFYIFKSMEEMNQFLIKYMGQDVELIYLGSRKGLEHYD